MITTMSFKSLSKVLDSFSYSCAEFDVFRLLYSYRPCIFHGIALQSTLLYTYHAQQRKYYIYPIPSTLFNSLQPALVISYSKIFPYKLNILQRTSFSSSQNTQSALLPVFQIFRLFVWGMRWFTAHCHGHGNEVWKRLVIRIPGVGWILYPLSAESADDQVLLRPK